MEPPSFSVITTLTTLFYDAVLAISTSPVLTSFFSALNALSLPSPFSSTTPCPSPWLLFPCSNGFLTTSTVLLRMLPSLCALLSIMSSAVRP
ncbi:hypothetical protein FB567DRAFT_533035 [Paraphoma chrysanthemicola]|uniref:Uncharacterized protein n=1 Tax=Paraphoma chrysanthemicola TaxID=798071 RepID=A0A8K0R077_9PLEO|nr:hypothetical protein FB567DRAFT_533035 [Paraphoma chrysanthemicola]